MTGEPRRSTLFPYTTLFRSARRRSRREARGEVIDRERAVVAAEHDVDAAVTGQRGRPYRAVGVIGHGDRRDQPDVVEDRKSTRLNSSHANISYAVFCLKKKY